MPWVNSEHLLSGSAPEDQRLYMESYTCQHSDVSLSTTNTSSPQASLPILQDSGADDTTSLLEMFVGIICACMPAAAHTCHHHLPSYDSFKNILRSRYGSLQNKLRSYSAFSSLPEDSAHDVGTSRGVHEGYGHGGTMSGRARVAAKPLQTFVQRGTTADDLNHDGIHLTYEMRQSSTSPETYERGQTG